MAQTLPEPVPEPAGAAVPRHIAIIMDGNGRWAKARGLPRSLGHRSGVEAVRRTIRAAIALRVECLTLYSFSTENWSRPVREVDDLMGLMKRFLLRDLAELHQTGVQIRVLGSRTGVDAELLALIDKAVTLTADNEALVLCIAFNYGARDEIADAARDLAVAAAEGRIDPKAITADTLSEALTTRGLPDPDLLIRTSGELRLSNFLLWQLAYAEFVFLEESWPDFGHDLLVKAIDIYQSRDRRFGAIASSSPA
ncbi:MAG: isoprenyl transferase [Pseudomonadota bacterium]